jgi:sugar phosphate isomerase/epimerase
MMLTRRETISALTGAAISATTLANAAPEPFPNRLPICVFSKHLQWLNWADTADAVKEIGGEGVDLTVRPGGHVLPERLDDDFPQAVADIRGRGVPVTMITSRIRDLSTPGAEKLLRMTKQLGIRHYRWGDFPYEKDKPLPKQLDEWRPRVKELAAFNKELGLTAMYHIHSGFNRIGSGVWDLWLLLKDEDPSAVSVNFDIAHATIEGGYGAWVNSMKLMLPHMGGTATKDFLWQKNRRGEWRPRWKPIGEGMVDWKRYFEMLRGVEKPMPLQIHFEYPEIGDAARGRTKLTVPRETVLGYLKKDIAALKRFRKIALG